MALTPEQKEAFKIEKAEREQYWQERYKIRKQEIMDTRSKIRKQQEQKIHCPICNSTQIAARDKGFSLGRAAVGGISLGPVGLLGGLIGSKRVIITCLNCGEQWEPGR